MLITTGRYTFFPLWVKKLKKNRQSMVNFWDHTKMLVSVPPTGTGLVTLLHYLRKKSRMFDVVHLTRSIFIFTQDDPMLVKINFV